MTLRTDSIDQRLRSKLRSVSSRPNVNAEATQRSVELEMTLPVALCVDQQNTVTCCFTEATVTSGSSDNTAFVLEIAEFALRCRLRWQNLLEDVRTIGSATRFPDVDLTADGQLVILANTLGLSDFMNGRETLASLTSYNSVIPEVSRDFTMTVTVSLKHKVSGRRIHPTATLPVVIMGSTAEQTMPPDYERLEATQETTPPPHEDASDQWKLHENCALATNRTKDNFSAGRPFVSHCKPLCRRQTLTKQWHRNISRFPLLDPILQHAQECHQASERQSHLRPSRSRISCTQRGRHRSTHGQTCQRPKPRPLANLSRR